MARRNGGWWQHLSICFSKADRMASEANAATVLDGASPNDDSGERLWGQERDREIQTWSDEAKASDGEAHLLPELRSSGGGCRPTTKTNADVVLEKLPSCIVATTITVHACAGKVVVRPGDVFVTRRPMWLACVYAKCGHMVAMTKAFDEMPHRGVPSWNALIVGLRKERKAQRVFHGVAAQGQEVPLIGQVIVPSALSAGDGRLEHVAELDEEAVIPIQQEQVELPADRDALHVHLHEQRSPAASAAAAASGRRLLQGAPEERLDRRPIGVHLAVPAYAAITGRPFMLKGLLINQLIDGDDGYKRPNWPIGWSTVAQLIFGCTVSPRNSNGNRNLEVVL
uniref:Uncharacterized protein n=1 Tax=Oryza glumipatula TaxID=40148 RepID=A0A0D9Y700_9ORYZ